MGQDSVTIDLKGNNRQLKSSLGQSESMINKFGGAVKKVAIVLAAAFAAKKLYDFGKASFALFEVQEKAEKRLESVIKATGGAAGYSAEQLKQMASGLQQVTTVGDEVILGAQSIIATFKNIRGEEFARATELALDMSTVLGGDASSSAMQLAKALNDPIKGLTMLTRVGVTFSDEQKKMVQSMIEAGDVAGAQGVIMDELAGQLGGAARDQAETFSGKMQQLKNRFGDFQENLIKAVIPALEELFPVLDAMMNGLENLTGPLQKATKLFIKGAQAVYDYIKPALEWLVDAGIAAFSLFQVAIENWSDTSRLAMMKWYLGYVKVFETLKHWLLNVIPDLLSWFGRNWFKIWWDLQQAQARILINMGKNIWNFIVEVKNALTGKGFNFKWTGLLEGFEATLDELPQIAKRKLSAEEEGIQAEIDDLQGSLTEKFVDKFMENKQAVADFFKPGEKIDLGDIKFDESVYDNPYAVTQPKTKKDEKKDKEETTGDSQGKTEGLESLYQRISEAAAKQEDKQVQKDQLAKLGEIAEGVKAWGESAWKSFRDSDTGSILGPALESWWDRLSGQQEPAAQASLSQQITEQNNLQQQVVTELRRGNQIALTGYDAVGAAVAGAGALQ